MAPEISSASAAYRTALPASFRPGIFYGWFVVAASFLNLFFTTGVIYYSLPVFYPSFVSALGFTRAQVTQGFLIGFLAVGLPFGYIAGVLVDRLGARTVILLGLGFVGVPLTIMGFMHHLWQYQVLCLLEVLGYVLAGPVSNQVLIARWFSAHRGRAMGFAYLGLGLGGVIAPPAASVLIHAYGWRHAMEIVGCLILLVLFPVNIFITRSGPAEMDLLPDGAPAPLAGALSSAGASIGEALRTRNFWLLTIGSGLVVGAINTVIQHFILLLVDHGYTRARGAAFLSALLASSLAGRILVGYLADRVRQKKNVMALFYLLIGASVPLLLIAAQPIAAWSFALLFGFSMGADYMLIPLVTAECFGLASFGKILGAVITGYSVGQWVAPWVAGKVFDARHSYDPAWMLLCGAGLLGALAIFLVRPADRTVNKVWVRTAKETM